MSRERIVIRKLMFQETGIFRDIYSRPLELAMNDGADEKIRNRLAKAHRDGRLSAAAFKGVGSRILTPSINVHGRDLVHVPNGWDEPRCRFSMEVEITNRVGGEETMFVQGFTDHLGLSGSGNLDPDMKLYINGFIRVGYGHRDTAFGREEVPLIKEMAQVISGKLVYDRDFDTHAIRPVDMYSRIQTQFYDMGSSEPLRDTRSMVSSPGTALFARRNHVLPGEYLASTLQSFRAAADMVDFGVGAQDTIGYAQQDLNADIETMRDNPFIRRISAEQGLIESVEFTIRDLLNIDPNAGRERRISGSSLTLDARAELATIENCSRWDDRTLQAQWAVQISNGIAAIMMKRYHRMLSFTATNKSTGNVVVAVQDTIPLADGMPLSFIDRMIEDIEDLLFDLCGNNEILFDVTVDANLYDQTRIDLQIERDPFELFYVPSFADSLMNSMYTRDLESVENIVNDFQSIIRDLAGELSGSSQELGNAL